MLSRSGAHKKVLNYIQFKYLKAFTVVCAWSWSKRKKLNQHFIPEESKEGGWREEGSKGIFWHEITSPASAETAFALEHSERLEKQTTEQPQDSSLVCGLVKCAREQRIYIIRFCYLIILKGFLAFSRRVCCAKMNLRI